MRWLRGSASDLIFAPWLSAIERDGGRVLGGKRVSTIRFKANRNGNGEGEPASINGKGVTGLRGGDKGEEGAQESSSGGDADAGADASPVRVETTDGEVFEPDAVVLAVGITAAKVSCHRCTQHLRKWKHLEPWIVLSVSLRRMRQSQDVGVGIGGFGVRR